jgi:hypothetical protein
MDLHDGIFAIKAADRARRLACRQFHSGRRRQRGVDTRGFILYAANPPWLGAASSVFGPVWTVLYALMGIAAWLVWRVDGFTAAPLSTRRAVRSEKPALAAAVVCE